MYDLKYVHIYTVAVQWLAYHFMGCWWVDKDREWGLLFLCL